jgi:hypothetical protein
MHISVALLVVVLNFQVAQFIVNLLTEVPDFYKVYRLYIYPRPIKDLPIIIWLSLNLVISLCCWVYGRTSQLEDYDDILDDL